MIGFDPRKMAAKLRFNLGIFMINLEISHPRVRGFLYWFERLYWAQHNAKVIEDFEDRMSRVIYAATDGRLSKPYYAVEAMEAEIYDAFIRKYDEGYSDGVHDERMEHQ